MTTISSPVSTKNAITISLDSLASATYVASSVIDFTGVNPNDAQIEVTIVTTSTAPSGNKQVKVFLQTSLDNSVFSTGPTSGTTTTDEPDLMQLGVVPCNTASATHRRHFGVLAALGFIPRYAKLVCFDDLGTALSTGCSANWSSVVGNNA